MIEIESTFEPISVDTFIEDGICYIHYIGETQVGNKKYEVDIPRIRWDINSISNCCELDGVQKKKYISIDSTMTACETNGVFVTLKSIDTKE